MFETVFLLLGEVCVLSSVYLPGPHFTTPPRLAGLPFPPCSLSYVNARTPPRNLYLETFSSIFLSYSSGRVCPLRSPAESYALKAGDFPSGGKVCTWSEERGEGARMRVVADVSSAPSHRRARQAGSRERGAPETFPLWPTPDDHGRGGGMAVPLTHTHSSSLVMPRVIFFFLCHEWDDDKTWRGEL